MSLRLGLITARNELKDRILRFTKYTAGLLIRQEGDQRASLNPIFTDFPTNMRENLSATRFGQTVDHKDMANETARNTIANLLNVKMPEMVFSEPLEVRDFRESEEGELVEDITAKLRELKIKDEIIKAAQLENRDGCVAFAIFKDSEFNLELHVFGRKHIWVRRNPLGTIIQFKLEKQLPRGSEFSNPVFYVPGEWQQDKKTRQNVFVGGGELDDIVFCITRPHMDYPQEGVPYLLPLWDIVKSINISAENVTLRSVKAGSLVKTGTMAIPPAGQFGFNLKDRESDFKTGLKEMDRDTIVLLKRYLTSQGPLEDNINLLDVDVMGRYLEVLEFFIWIVSAWTGLPANWFKGLISGELTGSTEVARAFQAYFKNIQKLWSSFHDKLAERLCELLELSWQEGYHVVYPLKQKLTEDQEAVIMQQKVATAVQAVQSGLWNQGEGREYTDKDPSIKVERPADMMINIGGQTIGKSTTRPEGRRGDNIGDSGSSEET